jgi:hypothetical protein
MSSDDYFAELVEHLTAITPDIDRRVATILMRHYRRHAQRLTRSRRATGTGTARRTSRNPASG